MPHRPARDSPAGKRRQDAIANAGRTSPAETAVDIAHQKLQRVFTIANVNYPQLFADVNRDQCQAMGLQLKDVNDTLQIYLGSLYVNDFNRFGRTWQVVVQADAEIPQSTWKTCGGSKCATRRERWRRWARVGRVRLISGPLVVTRYNLYPARRCKEIGRPASAPARRSMRWKIWPMPCCRRK